MVFKQTNFLKDIIVFQTLRNFFASIFSKFTKKPTLSPDPAPAPLTLKNWDDVWVQSYLRDDGTQVPGHFRTAPNDTAADNYSTPGNVNPYKCEKCDCTKNN